MFNPSSSRSRLRVVDAGRRYGVRLREGMVEYSTDGDVSWRPITPLVDQCSGQVIPPFVSHNETRAGRALSPVTFDMIAVGRGRILAKEAGSDRLFHLVMDELFRTRRVSGPDCEIDVDVGCRDEDPYVPGFYMKLDPEYFLPGPPSVVVPPEARRTYANHPASGRLAAFAELLELGVTDLMLVMQRARTWYQVDPRSPRSIVGPEDLRFNEADLKATLTEQKLHEIVDAALRGWDDPISKWLLGGEIDRLVRETYASIVAEGFGGLVFPAYVGLGLLGHQLHEAGVLRTEDGRLKFRPGKLLKTVPPNKPLLQTLERLMLLSRRRATAWPDSAPGMPTPNQPPLWMPTYEHVRYVPARRFSNWELLDANAATVALVADGGALYQLHNSGAIFKYVGTPNWQLLDDNAQTKQIVAAGGNLYQLHNGGAIFKYTGPPITGWELLDANAATVALVADGGALYQLHNSGAIFKYVGTPNWQLLDDNAQTKQIVAAGGNLYQLHNGGAIFKYTGPPITGWELLDANAATVALVADGGALYQLHNSGAIFKYVGTPNWQLLDDNAQTKQIVAAGGNLYQLHNGGAIFKYTGPPITGWQQFDDNSAARRIAAGGSELYQLHETGSIWRATGPPEEVAPDESRFAIQFSKVLDLGVGYSHWSEQWLRHYGGEIHSLLAGRPLFQDEPFPLIQYRFLNGPIIDGDGSIDGTTNFYMLVKLGPPGSDGHGLKQRYAVLWIDEQTYFTQRWRLLHPTDDVLGDLASLPHLLKDNPEWFHFSRKKFWSPFEVDSITEQSRMAVRRQIVAVTGFDRAAKRHEIYTICFNYGICDHTWRWRRFPAATPQVIEPSTAQDQHPPLPPVMTSGNDAAYVAVNTLDLRDDTTLHVRGTKRAGPGKPLRPGRWVQRYLPADCRHVPASHRLLPGTPAPKPAAGFSHPWDFISETAYRRADRFYQFGVYAEGVDSRCQYYEVQLLPDAGGQVPQIKDVVSRVWHNHAEAGQFAAPAEPLHHNTANVEWALEKDASGAIVLNDMVRARNELPTMSMYEKTTRFRLLERKPLGLIAVYYDKRDDELQPGSNLPHESAFEEDFEDDAVPPEWAGEDGGEACGPTPIPRPPKTIRLLVKRNRRVLTPPVVPKAQVVIDRTKPQRALRVSFWTPQTEAEVAEGIWKVALAALGKDGVVPIFSLNRFSNFVRRANPTGPAPFDSDVDLDNAWRYDCVWQFDTKLHDRIDRLCTPQGHTDYATSLWFENVVGQRSLAQQLVFA